MEREIKCYKLLWRLRKVSGGIVPVRRGMLKGANGKSRLTDNKEKLG